MLCCVLRRAEPLASALNRGQPRTVLAHSPRLYSCALEDPVAQRHTSCFGTMPTTSRCDRQNTVEMSHVNCWQVFQELQWATVTSRLGNEQ